MLIGSLIYLCALRTLPDDRPGRAAAAPKAPFDRSDWHAFVSLWLLFIPGCLFWATYEQSGNTIEVWSVDRLNRLVSLGPLSFTLTVGMIQAFNSFFIMALTPLVIWFWKWQEARDSEPTAVIKMVFGFVILSCSYLILAAGQALAGGHQVHWLWCLAYFALLTLGELYFSPVGLSLYSKATPPQVAALMMAVFLATSFPGNFIAGWLGKFYSTMTNTHFFLFIAVIAFLPAPVIWSFNGPMKRIIREHEARRLRGDNLPARTTAP
jgi:POT family proton-dependent oligopeptide transporter